MAATAAAAAAAAAVHKIVNLMKHCLDTICAQDRFERKLASFHGPIFKICSLVKKLHTYVFTSMAIWKSFIV